jgi:hypothetical protein
MLRHRPTGFPVEFPVPKEECAPVTLFDNAVALVA